MSNKEHEHTYPSGTESDDGISIIADEPKKRRKKKSDLIRRMQRAGKSRGKVPISVGIVAAVIILLLVFVTADVNTGGFLSEVNGKFISFLSRSSSENFSVSTDSERIYAFQAYGSGFVILTENGVTYISSSGQQTTRQQLSLSSPDMSSAANRTLIFDRGNTDYALLNNGSLYSSQTANKNIIDAAVCKNGYYAMAVKDDNAKTILYGFDVSGEMVFQWNCPTGYIADVAMAPSGTKVAATVVNSENAVLSTKVFIFDFNYNSAYAEFDFADEIVVGLRFLSGSKLQIVSENKVYLAKKRDLTTVYAYNSANIAFTDLSGSGFSAVVTDDYSKDDSYMLTIFGKDGQLHCEIPLSGKVRGVSASDKSVSVLFADKTETYSKRGKNVGTVTNLKHYNNIVLSGNYIYLLTSDSVKKYPAYGSVNVASAEDTTT